MLNKNRLRKYTNIGNKQLQKKSAAHVEEKHRVTYVAGYNDSRTLYIASYESCQPNRNLFGVGTKLKESIFKSNNQISSTVTTRTWVLSKEWIRKWPNTGLISE